MVTLLGWTCWWILVQFSLFIFIFVPIKKQSIIPKCSRPPLHEHSIQPVSNSFVIVMFRLVLQLLGVAAVGVEEESIPRVSI
jgi:hypothetical protein